MSAVTKLTPHNPTTFALTQALDSIEKEMRHDPPFSIQNDVRRAELDQLRDMIDRRT